MTRGNTYGSTDSSPGDHQFSIGLWPVFLDSFSSMHLKITFLDVFLKIIPVLFRKFKKNRKTTEEKLTIHNLSRCRHLRLCTVHTCTHIHFLFPLLGFI